MKCLLSLYNHSIHNHKNITYTTVKHFTNNLNHINNLNNNILGNNLNFTNPSNLTNTNNIPSPKSLTPEDFQNLMEISNKMERFIMPYGWKWTFPFIKQTSILLLYIQSATGMSYFSLCIFSAFTIRLLLFPFIIKQIRSTYKISRISPNIKLLGNIAFTSNASNTTSSTSISRFKKLYYFMRSMSKYSKDVNVSILLFIAYNMLQFPLFFFIIFSIRKISLENNLETKVFYGLKIYQSLIHI